MRAIFISYRREDAEGQAGRLFDDLCEHFGSDAVFMDVAAIEPGRDFRRVIDEHVASCGVLLAIIGKGWLTARNAAGERRLDEATDFVRIETASALKRDIPVVPVLVHGAKMPGAEDLPADLRELAFRNGVELTHARWDSDVQVLVKALRPYVDARNATAPRPAAQEQASGRAGRPGMGKAMLAAAGVLAVVIAGLAWQQHSRAEAERAAIAAEAARIAALEAEKLRVIADEQAARRARAQADAEARRKRLADEAAQKARDAQQAKEDAERARRDAEARAKDQAAKLAAAQRARWKEGNFPPPNAGRVLYTITSSGDPACASYNGGGCLWGMSHEQVDFSRLKPVVCGSAHKAMWGTTGYEDPKHWCSLARRGYTG